MIALNPESGSVNYPTLIFPLSYCYQMNEKRDPKCGKVFEKPITKLDLQAASIFCDGNMVKFERFHSVFVIQNLAEIPCCDSIWEYFSIGNMGRIRSSYYDDLKDTL